MTTLVLLYMLSYGRREHEEMGSRSTGLVTDTLVVNQGMRPKLWHMLQKSCENSSGTIYSELSVYLSLSNPNEIDILCIGMLRNMILTVIMPEYCRAFKRAQCLDLWVLNVSRFKQKAPVFVCLSYLVHTHTYDMYSFCVLISPAEKKQVIEAKWLNIALSVISTDSM